MNHTFGTLTADDKPAIAAVLEEAGIEGVEASLSQSGTVFFVLTKRTALGNDAMQDPELRQRIVTAFEEAGWTWGPALSLVAAPAPQDASRIELPAAPRGENIPMTMQPLSLPLSDVMHLVNTCHQQTSDDSLTLGEQETARTDATGTLDALADALADLARIADERATQAGESDSDQDADQHMVYAALAEDLQRAADAARIHRDTFPRPSALGL